MNINVKLEDPKSCQGCPFGQHLMGMRCILEFWGPIYFGGFDATRFIPRPQACIDKHGE